LSPPGPDDTLNGLPDAASAARVAERDDANAISDLAEKSLACLHFLFGLFWVLIF